MSRISIALLIATLLVLGGYLLLQPDRHLPVTPTATTATLDKPPAEVRFEPMALRWGVAASHQQGAGKLEGLTEAMGAGLCVLDANGDSWPDLFFVGGSGNRRHYGDAAWWFRGEGNRLYLNRGNGLGFDDVSEDWGIDHKAWGMGCAAADLDADGRPELLVYGVGANLLYRNEGDRYALQENIPALDADRWTLGASVGDFNRDGRPDVYLSNYVEYRKGERTFEAFSGFDVVEDAAFDASLYDAQANQLLVNRGELQFDESAEALGVSNAQGRSLGARWLDLNGDAWPDLVVMNEHGTPNAIYLNEQGRGFRQAPQALAPLALGGSHDLQLLAGDSARDYFFTRGTGFINALLGDQNGLVDISRNRGLGLPLFFAMQSWGAVASDFNNDGFTDLYVANGQLRPDPDARHLSTGQADSLLLGGARTFVLDEAAGHARRFVSSRSVVRADFDGDGRQDLAVAGNNGPVEILRNVSDVQGSWLGVRLPESERAGARVRISSGDFSQSYPVASLEGFLGQSEDIFHLGLGPSSTAMLEIAWRDGSRTRHQLEQLDRVVVPYPDGRLDDLERSAGAVPPDFRGLDGIAAQAWPSLARAGLALDRPQLLLDLWERGDAMLRKAVLESLERDQGLLSLQLLEAGLSETDPEVVSVALDAAHRLEFERSVDWVIAVFDSEDAATVCHAASVLEHFYEQEEAAIRRKYLAVPPLMRLLSRPDVAACAARALGAAEKKRAVPALLTVLDDSEDSALRVQAIRSLGLLRDTQALAPLQNLAVSAGAEALAAAMVARVRLAEPPDTVLRSLEQLPVAQQLDVMAQIYMDEDSAVLPRRPLNAKLDRLLSRGTADLSAVRAMAASGREDFAPALSPATRSPDDAVVRTAFLGLARLGVDSALAQLAERELELVQEVLREVPTAPLGPEPIVRLLGRGFPAHVLGPQLSRLSATDFDRVMELMAEASIPATEPVLQACGEVAGVVDARNYLDLADELLVSDAALDCFFGDAGGMLRQRDIIARRVVVKRAMGRLHESGQRELRQKLAGRDSFYAEKGLFEPLTATTAAWLLAYLEKQPDADALPQLARLAEDRRLDTISRARALEQLATRDAKRAELALQGLLK